MNRARRPDDNRQSLRYLLNRFYTSNKAKVDAGKQSPHTFKAYELIGEELVKAFGRDRLLSDITPADFEALRIAWEKRWSDVRICR